MKKLFNKGTLLTIGGLAVAVTGAVMMKKASLKCNEIVFEHKNTVAIIEECYAKCGDYSEEDKEKDTVINNTQTAIKMVKNYTVPVTLCVLGGCVTIKGVSTYIKHQM